MSTALFTVVKIEICEAVGKCKISGYLGDHRSTSRETHPTHRNNKKRSHTQLDSRKQVIAFQDRVITINIKEAQHPLKWEKQVIDKSSIMLKISTKSMHRVLVWKTTKFSQKQNEISMIHRPAGCYHQRNCVFCLWFIIAELFCLQHLFGVWSLQISN